LKTLLKIPLFLLGDILYLLSLIIPRRKNLWIFGAWFGQRYSDNPRALFEYVNSKYPEIEAVWLTRNIEVKKIIEKYNYRAHYTFSLAGIWSSLRAGAGIICTDIRDLNLFTSGGLKVIQLWHGSPIKKIIFDDRLAFKRPSAIKSILFPFSRLKFSQYLFTAASEEVKSKLAGAFRVDPDHVKVTGYPRNDLFYRRETRHLSTISELKEIRLNCRIGIYLPTHRSEGKTEYLKNMIPELKELDSRLKEMNIILLIKQHFYHQNTGEDDFAGFTNIRFISDRDIEHDIHAILPLTDFLITDYSSILFDYLLLGKPVIFFPFDMGDYAESDREFYYEYGNITPGPVVKSWSELADKLKDVLENPEPYSRERENLLDKFNHFKDGDSSARVFGEIREFLA
jgi:CDP-glycerol glycerophosphotransferase (TagB/SpsB family)